MVLWIKDNILITESESEISERCKWKTKSAVSPFCRRGGGWGSCTGWSRAASGKRFVAEEEKYWMLGKGWSWCPAAGNEPGPSPSQRSSWTTRRPHWAGMRLGGWWGQRLRTCTLPEAWRNQLGLASRFRLPSPSPKLSSFYSPSQQASVQRSRLGINACMQLYYDTYIYINTHIYVVSIHPSKLSSGLGMAVSTRATRFELSLACPNPIGSSFCF